MLTSCLIYLTIFTSGAVLRRQAGRMGRRCGQPLCRQRCLDCGLGCFSPGINLSRLDWMQVSQSQHINWSKSVLGHWAASLSRSSPGLVSAVGALHSASVACRVSQHRTSRAPSPPPTPLGGPVNLLFTFHGSLLLYRPASCFLFLSGSFRLTTSGIAATKPRLLWTGVCVVYRFFARRY